MKKKLLLFFLLIILTFSLQAYDHKSFNIGIHGEVPLNVKSGPAFGAFFEYRTRLNLGLMLDFEFSKSYYYFADGSWYGPVPWAETGITGVKARDWIFYQWNWQVQLIANWYIPLKSPYVAPFIGGGLTFNFVFKSKSANNYPEYNDYYTEKKREMSYLPGIVLRGGAEFTILPGRIFFGAGTKFKLDDIKNLGENVRQAGFGRYFVNHCQIFLYLSVGF